MRVPSYLHLADGHIGFVHIGFVLIYVPELSFCESRLFESLDQLVL